jgi:hypothetical protein
LWWWHPAHVFSIKTPLVILSCYWMSVLACLGPLTRIRRHPRLTVLSVLMTLGLLMPATQTAMLFTFWSVRGFAP